MTIYFFANKASIAWTFILNLFEVVGLHPSYKLFVTTNETLKILNISFGIGCWEGRGVIDEIKHPSFCLMR